MSNRSVLYLGLFGFIISLMGLVVPFSVPITVMLPDQIAAIVCLLLSSGLIALFIFENLRKAYYRAGFIVLGLGLVLTAVFGVISPTYFGILANFIRPADLLPILICGIGYLAISSEPQTDNNSQFLQDPYQPKLPKQHFTKN